jgi:hypothetical protein
MSSLTTQRYQLTDDERSYIHAALQQLIICDETHDLDRLIAKFATPHDGKNVYDREPFTDFDRQAIFDSCCDEAADMSRREAGEMAMSEISDDIAECIGYACDHVDTLSQALKAIHQGLASIESIRSNAAEEYDYVADFIERFKLVEDNKLTDLGGLVMNHWG